MSEWKNIHQLEVSGGRYAKEYYLLFMSFKFSLNLKWIISNLYTWTSEYHQFHLRNSIMDFDIDLFLYQYLFYRSDTKSDSCEVKIRLCRIAYEIFLFKSLLSKIFCLRIPCGFEK